MAPIENFIEITEASSAPLVSVGCRAKSNAGATFSTRCHGVLRLKERSDREYYTRFSERKKRKSEGERCANEKLHS